MTEFGLYPAYVRLDYASAYAPHTRLLPTLAWVQSSITGTMGSYISWSGVPRDAEDMIDDLVAKMKPFDDPTTTYNLATIYVVDAVTNQAVPQVFKSLAVVGTSAAAGVRKAVQSTFNFRTVALNAFKVVFLDSPHGTGQFDKALPTTFSADAIALEAELGNTGNAWSARDNSKPNGLVSVTYTLNEALRKQYRMG